MRRPVVPALIAVLIAGVLAGVGPALGLLQQLGALPAIGAPAEGTPAA